MTKHIIVYSHGFGVRKDDRGLFTDIAKALPTFQHNMFDYSMHDDATNTLTVRSLDGQVIMLREVITRTRAENPTAVIDLVCHSQGCVVAALAKPQGLRKTIFIGAPAELSVDDMIRIFSARPGSEINRSGVSRLSRADFSTTLVPPEYWESIENIEPISLYNDASQVASMVLINGTEDEIIGSRDFTGLRSGIKVVEIKTGHNFEGTGRGELIAAITREVK